MKGVFQLIAICLLGPGLCTAQDTLNWEPFAARFRQPLRANMVEVIEQDLAVTYNLHLATPDNTEHLAAMASFHFQLLDFNEAAACYARLLRINPEHKTAPAWFAECLYHAGSLEPAKVLLQKFERAGTATPITTLVLAEIYYRQKKTTLAIQQLELVLKNTEPQAQDPMYAILRKHVVHNLRVLGEDYIQ